MNRLTDSTLKNRYFIVTRSIPSVREWCPPNWRPDMPVDCRYFGLAFVEMERYLKVGGLDIYVTWDINSLPDYGHHVVALMVGDEMGRIPRYVRHVRAVFKTSRLCPYLGIRRSKLDLLRLALLMRTARDWAAYFVSRLRLCWTPRSWPAPVHRAIRVLNIPLGYFLHDLLPQKTMQERPYHCVFGGTVQGKRKNGLSALIPRPKQVSRTKMLRVVDRLRQTEPELRLDVSVAGAGCETQERPERTYSQRLMDSKFCLAPRGNVIDTWRFFEGMRSGCIVICEPLPDDWYYKGAPVIQLDDWEELQLVIRSYLDEDEKLEQMRRHSLEWWKTQCSEAAVGRAMADFIHNR